MVISGKWDSGCFLSLSLYDFSVFPPRSVPSGDAGSKERGWVSAVTEITISKTFNPQGLLEPQQKRLVREVVETGAWES